MTECFQNRGTYYEKSFEKKNSFSKIFRRCVMSRRSRYRRCLIWTFWVGVLFTIGFSYYYMERVIPDRLSIVLEQEETLNLAMPVRLTLESESEEVVLGGGSNIPSDQITIEKNEAISLYGKTQGSYQLGVDLFGMIRLKEIQVDVVDTQYVIPCGAPVGIYLKSNGVMVIGTGELINQNGTAVEPAAGILKTGDYIEAINGKPLSTKEQLARAVEELEGQDAVLTIRRQDKQMEVSVSPAVTQDGKSKLGVWVRSDTQGIGTMTYIDLNGRFGALGHGISDTDTGEVVEISEGNLYDTQIVGVEKGAVGSPGVMSGVIYYGPGTLLGDVNANTEQGIFGTVNEKFMRDVTAESMEVGFKQDVKKGKASIRSGVSGEIKDYEIEILKVDYSNSHSNKSLVIQVTDPELLELTGGIVQGMSGSPIMQDGKIIGAVTHVFVNDPTKGYGIFVEDMLGAAQ